MNGHGFSFPIHRVALPRTHITELLDKQSVVLSWFKGGTEGRTYLDRIIFLLSLKLLFILT
jgi:hypothetical protein